MSPKIGKRISTAALVTAAAVSSAAAGDLSRYRDFQLGMDLNAVTKQDDLQTSALKMIHQRPAVIQDLEWRPRAFPARSAESDPVRDVLLSFYNGQLFRIVANYDRFRTEGMTAGDMIDAISATYGPAAKPAAELLFPSFYSERVKVLARWENAEYSLNLVRPPYQTTFALVLFSKQLDSLAQAAAIESVRLDSQEVAQSEAAQTRRQAEEFTAKEEKARTVNKSGFRP